MSLLDEEEEIKNEYESVDHKEVTKYKTVKPGESIAMLTRGSPGEEGRTVYGDVIKPKKARRIEIQGSRNISFEEESGIIRSKKYGTPVKVERGNNIHFEMHERLLLEEVSLKTGNIRYKGDVEVRGSVYEGMEIISNNDIMIFGNVSFAALSSGNNMTVKGNVVSSKLISGYEAEELKDPNVEVRRIIVEIGNLIKNIKKLSRIELEKLGIRDMPNTVHYMLNMKNRALPYTIYDVLRKLRKDNYDIDENSITILLEKCKCFLGTYGMITDLEYIVGVKESLKNKFCVDEKRNITGNIFLNSAMNSEVRASGDISILGRTCLNTRIYAGGRVVIKGNLRLGEVKSERCIDINKVGTEMGTKIILEVPDKGIIRMRCVYPDTTIILGRHSYKFVNYQTSIHARVIENKLHLR